MEYQRVEFEGLLFVRIEYDDTIVWTFEEGVSAERREEIKENVRREWLRVCRQLRW